MFSRPLCHRCTPTAAPSKSKVSSPTPAAAFARNSNHGAVHNGSHLMAVIDQRDLAVSPSPFHAPRSYTSGKAEPAATAPINFFLCKDTIFKTSID